jgi:hypothetical protein
MGRANIIMDNLIAAGKAKPMILVMPNGNATQSVSQGFGYGPTPARQSVQAPAPPPVQAQAAQGGQPGGGRGGAPQPYAGSYPESLVKDVIHAMSSTARFGAAVVIRRRGVRPISLPGGPAYHDRPGQMRSRYAVRATRTSTMDGKRLSGSASTAVSRIFLSSRATAGSMSTHRPTSAAHVHS